MVGAVKRWQTSDPQKALETWKKLAEANSALEMQLKILSKFAEEQWDMYRFIIRNCSEYTYDKVIFRFTSYLRRLSSIGSLPCVDEITVLVAYILVAC